MSDRYGESDFGRVPRGPFKGRPWSEVPALTLHSILNAVDFGCVELDERRVAAIREGLRAKDHPTHDASTYAKAAVDKSGGKRGMNDE